MTAKEPRRRPELSEALRSSPLDGMLSPAGVQRAAGLTDTQPWQGGPSQQLHRAQSATLGTRSLKPLLQRASTTSVLTGTQQAALAAPRPLTGDSQISRMPQVQRPGPEVASANVDEEPSGLGASQELRWSRKMHSFDRKMSTEFHRHRQKAQLAERPGSRGSASENTGIAVSTHRENFKRERYAQQLDRLGEPCAGREDGTDVFAALAQEMEALQVLRPEAFQADAKELDRQIEEISRNLRMESFSAGAQDARLRAEREEARRAKEAELRRARKKEQEARDPKKKVVLRLENKRRFGFEESTEAKIPMTAVEIVGATGKSQVSMVDVLALKNKCKFMDHKASVPEMVEVARAEERHKRSATSSIRSLSASGTASSSFQAMSSSSRPLSTMSYQERHRRVAEARHANFAESLVFKIGRMRSTLDSPLPYGFDVHVAKNKGDSSGDDWTDEEQPPSRLTIVKASDSGLFPPEKVDALQAALKQQLLHKNQKGAGRRRSSIADPAVLAKMITQISGSQAKPCLAEIRTVIAPEASPEGMERPAPAAEPAAPEQPRGRSHWVSVRAAAKVIGLYVLAKRRIVSQEIVKAFLVARLQWAAARQCLKRLSGSFKVFQQCFRSFMAKKKRRVAAMEKDWIRFEDQSLASYVRNCARVLAEEKKRESERRSGSDSKRRAKGKEASMSDSQRSSMEAAANTDWRLLRIPVRERRAVISRYYTFILKKTIRTRTRFLEAVQTALSLERAFDQSFRLGNEDRGSDHNTPKGDRPYSEGGSPSGKENHARPSICVSVAPEDGPVVDFYTLTEDLVLSLVALTAQSLEQLDPFQDHPANKDLPKNRRSEGSASGHSSCAAWSPRCCRSSTRILLRLIVWRLGAASML